MNKRVFFLFLIIFSLLMTASCSFFVQDESDTPSMNISDTILSVDDSTDTSVSQDTSSSAVSSNTSASPSKDNSSPASSSVTSSKDYGSSSSEAPNTYDGDWKLILVNSKNLLPDNFSVKTAYIGNRPMDERIVDIVKKMIRDAKNDGVDLLLASSYRTVERQTTLFNEQIQKFLNQGYRRKDAETEAAKWVAVPRTSEHHTGLALDIVTPTYQVLDFGFDQTDAFKWLYKNCTDYGFILRYPKDKSDITGIVYEPWHYRYVGIEAARYIRDNNLCLEEYIEELG